MGGEKFLEKKYNKEEEFENIVKSNAKRLFGNAVIYSDFKSKVSTETLGKYIPDGFMFDFKEKENPEFYLVEVELAKHSFNEHIFPQITKFFSFFKKAQEREKLVGKIYELINSNPSLEEEFHKLSGKKELYKLLKDTIDNSNNILLIIDDEKPEIHEVKEIYTDTWEKIVKVEILQVFTVNNKNIFTISPDFEELSEEVPEEDEEENLSRGKYTETYHFSDTDNFVLSMYTKIKNHMLSVDSDLIFNPQKYYISIRKQKNFAYLKIKKKKIRMVLNLSIDEAKKNIQHYRLKELSQGVQNFYNAICCQVFIENDDHLDEIFKALEEAYKKQN